MNLICSRLLILWLILCSFTGASSHAFAGDDSVAHVNVPDAKAAAAQIDGYLQGRGIKHNVSVTPASGDDKAQAPETVTVRVYGVIPAPEQDALCASLAAPARKASAHSVSVSFYEKVSSGTTAVAFQPSQLPSGNGDVSFAQGPDSFTYRLLRTVKL
jgi:hypothetical protein